MEKNEENLPSSVAVEMVDFLRVETVLSQCFEWSDWQQASGESFYSRRADFPAPPTPEEKKV
jgi:hypothetical protein